MSSDMESRWENNFIASEQAYEELIGEPVHDLLDVAADEIEAGEALKGQP